MKTFTRPKIFRSTQGCCICKAKSSSSRFTDSEKYEEDFTACFMLTEERRGEICNACVLVVKRWRKLPRRSLRNWGHVVDSKSGVGAGVTKQTSAKKKKQETCPPSTPSDEKLHKIRRKISRKRPKSSRQLVFSKTETVEIIRSRKMSKPKRLNISFGLRENLSDTFVSSAYWSKRRGCCGEVFCGQNGEKVMRIDQFQGCTQVLGSKKYIDNFVETRLEIIEEAGEEGRKKEDYDEGFCDKNSISTNPSSPESVKTINDDF